MFPCLLAHYIDPHPLAHLHGIPSLNLFTRSPPHPLTDLHGPPISSGAPTLPLPSLVSCLLLLLVLFFKLPFRLRVPHHFTLSNPVATLHKNVSQLQRRKGRPFFEEMTLEYVGEIDISVRLSSHFGLRAVTEF